MKRVEEIESEETFEWDYKFRPAIMLRICLFDYVPVFLERFLYVLTRRTGAGYTEGMANTITAMTKDQLVQMAWEWARAEGVIIPDEYYCSTRDIFQGRLEAMLTFLVKELDVEKAYMLSAIVGEIGNNSFDHNIGNWPDVPGVFFGYVLDGNARCIVLADRGQGVLKTLERVRPDLQSDIEALRLAFTEKISGRAPEDRGNGLKFVKESVKGYAFHAEFFSGLACARLNDSVDFSERNEYFRGCLAVLSL